jgi:fibronectin-binding autotransporter adhesin
LWSALLNFLGGNSNTKLIRFSSKTYARFVGYFAIIKRKAQSFRLWLPGWDASGRKNTVKLRIHRLAWGLILATLVLASRAGFATDYNWTAISETAGDWATASNWNNGVPASSTSTTLLFTSNGNYPTNFTLNNNISGTLTLRQLTFSSDAPSLRLTGNGLAFNNSSQNGYIYQRSANAEIIDNAISWSGTNPLEINNLGTGALTFTRSITNASGGTLRVLGSPVTLTGSLDTGASGDLRVGDAGLGALNLQMAGGNTAWVRGNLYLNNLDTRIGDTSVLTLTSGNLRVDGATIVGNASMYGGPNDFSAKFLQIGGTANLNGALAVGKNGSSNCLYDISGGILNANVGIAVGGPSTAGTTTGNGTMNIRGTAVVNINTNTGGLGLVIGQDVTTALYQYRTSFGMVQFTGGTLKVGDTSHVLDLKLGTNKGIGTFYRSGGTLGNGNAGVSGNLAVDGTGTLILDATSTNVSTAFGGLSRNSGTLVIVPYTGSFTANEKVSFTTAPALTNNILGPWAVVQTNGSTDTSGDYVTSNTGTGPYTLGRATYTTLSSSTTSNTVASISDNMAVTDNWSAYVVKIGPTASPTTTTISSTKTLTIAGGGMILNGETIKGGTLSLGGSGPMVFAGTSTDSTISSAIQTQTNAGLMKFGPGRLILSGDNTALTGEIAVCSGTLRAQDSDKVLGGATNKVTVATGATLEIRGIVNSGAGIYIHDVPIILNGAGVNVAGALRNMLNHNYLYGKITLGSASQIATDAGFLTLSGQVEGAYPLTKTGNGTLEIVQSISFSGPLTVAGGTLLVDNNSALGTSGASSGTTVNSGATLSIQNGISTAEPLTVSGSGVGNGGVVRNLSGSNTLSGNIALAGNSRVNIDVNSDILTMSGTISGNYALTKGGPGTLQLSGSGSSYTGTLTVLDGTLKVPGVNNMGSNGVFGAGLTPTIFGSSGKNPTFDYTGSSTSSNRAITLASGSRTNFQIEQPTETTVNLTLSGAIGGGGNLWKTNKGTLILSGTNTYTGTTIVTGSKLQIASGGSLSGTTGILVGNSATLQLLGSGNHLPDGTNITLIGGNLDFTGTGTQVIENVGSLILGPGLSTITTNNLGGGYLYFAGTSITRSPGAVVNFPSSVSVRFQDTTPVTNGIIGGFAFYNNADFATLSTSSPPTVQAYTGYTTGNLGAMSSNSALNVKASTTQTNISTKQFNSVNLTASANSLTINSGNTLTLTSGGLIVNTDSAATITGGTLTGSTSDGLIINALKNVTIYSTISGSLTKLGMQTMLALPNGYNNPSSTLTVVTGTLTSPSITCNTLIIGNGNVPGAGGAAAASSVPEPGGIVLILTFLFAFSGFGLRKYRAKK